MNEMAREKGKSYRWSLGVTFSELVEEEDAGGGGGKEAVRRTSGRSE